MKKNNWEHWHESAWTEFELHSAIFGHLRKNLYPEYLVRGEYVFITSEGMQLRPDISIFLPHKGKPATLLCAIEIKTDNNTFNPHLLETQLTKYRENLPVPVLFFQGRAALKTVLEEVREVLSKRV